MLHHSAVTLGSGLLIVLQTQAKPRLKDSPVHSYASEDSTAQDMDHPAFQPHSHGMLNAYECPGFYCLLLYPGCGHNCATGEDDNIFHERDAYVWDFAT